MTPDSPPLSFSRGFRDSSPVILGYFSASIAFGLLARNTGLNVVESLAFSFIVYTGAAQFMALNLIAAGVSGPQILIANFLLNLRYLFMSAAVARKVQTGRYFQRPLLAFGVTDETFALTVSQKGNVPPRYQAAVELFPWLAWNLGTLCGWFFGEILPESLSAAMVSSLYGLFIALLLPDLKKGWPWIITAAAAALINTALETFSGLGTGWNIVIAMLSGTIIGMALIPREEK
ncbi:MAG: branched-chain amino acid ABC transporter permease [Spirochaetales bacterium]|nr:MAG: branched-chain amino acid ABC transporter permease [Spirochaetales bacterium]